MIQFSPSAIGEIKRLQGKQERHDFFRLAVEVGGCSGYLYQLSFTHHVQPGDQQFQQQDIRVLIDPQSLTYLQGLTLDYSEDLMGGGFRFYNPRAQQTCGCGQSFALASTEVMSSPVPNSHLGSSQPSTPHLGAGI
jgi:iron-sulfur cluster assembly protein